MPATLWAHTRLLAPRKCTQSERLAPYVREFSDAFEYPVVDSFLGSLSASRKKVQNFDAVLRGVEVWRGDLGGAYRLPTLSSVGASLVPPYFRFHTPLIEPDVRICRIRLSEKTHAIAVAIACDAVCNFWKQLGSCQAHRQSPFPSSLRVSAFN
jgi:hypothetical protein